MQENDPLNEGHPGLDVASVVQIEPSAHRRLQARPPTCSDRGDTSTSSRPGPLRAVVVAHHGGARRRYHVEVEVPPAGLLNTSRGPRRPTASSIKKTKHDPGSAHW